MALRDLQTNLKSLQYPPKGAPLIDRVSFDGDKVGGNPTFIIGEDHSTNGIGSNQVDSIFRGGIKTHFNRASIDYQRINRYLLPKIDFDIGSLPSIDFGMGVTGFPNVDVHPGKWPELDISVPQFVQRQIGLQLMNPKISAPMGGLIDTAPANQRTFNPVSLAAQVFLSGTGIHIKREGLQPFNNRGYINNTRFDPSLFQDPTGDILGDLLPTKKFDSDGLDNRLINLYDSKIGDKGNLRDNVLSGTILGPLEIVNVIAGAIGDVVGGVLNRIGGKGEPLYDYWGGPGSMFGIGRTFIGRYTTTTHDSEGNPFPKITPIKDGHYEDGGFNYKIQNYLKSLGRPNAADYSTFTREQVYGLGTPGSNFRSGKYRKNQLSQPESDLALSQDKLNAYPIVRGSENDYEDDKMGEVPRDFVKFRFEAIDSMDPNTANLVVFRAFLSDVTDNYGATFNTYKYNGRAEEFYTYNKFKRDIQFNFKVAAQTRSELKPLYQKINYLASFTAPEYSSAGRIRTPFLRLTIGDWFKRLPGVLTSVGLKWSTEYSWEINEENSSAVKVLPHVLDVSCAYLPIHEFLPQRSPLSPFLGIGDWTTDPTEVSGKPIGGCMDPNYLEYNEDATYDDGTCKNHVQGYETGDPSGWDGNDQEGIDYIDVTPDDSMFSGNTQTT
jgi:hypothetical protein